MINNNIKIVSILVFLGASMMILSIGILFVDTLKDAYCSNLEPMEYFNNRECMESLRK